MLLSHRGQKIPNTFTVIIAALSVFAPSIPVFFDTLASPFLFLDIVAISHFSFAITNLNNTEKVNELINVSFEFPAVVPILTVLN